MPHPFRLAAASAAVLLAATTVHAQQVRSVRPATATAPSASARTAQAAPNPAGLRSPFPAGLTSGSGAAASTDPVAAGNAAVPPSSVGNTPGTGTGSGAGSGFAGTGSGQAGEGPDTTVMGAGAVGLVSRGPGQSVPLGSSGLNPVEVARAFIRADGNADGELSRGEAQRLGLPAMSFEEMDRDFDGIITRFEYQDGLR